MNKIEKQDIQEFVNSFELSEQLTNSTFLITGASGLIGSALIHCLIALDKQISITAPVRNIQKALSLFDECEKAWIDFYECDLMLFHYHKLGNIDYVVHCAAPTSSKFFVDQPVDTFNSIVEVTRRLLDYSNEYRVKSFIYLSSVEVYGTMVNDSLPVTEDVQGYLDPMAVRSSYPMAKRAAENLCALYVSQYGINVKVARLTQTTGAGLSDDDNRIIAQFAKLAAKGSDIILHTTGEASRPYCYTTDSISALLYILLKGEKGEAYNVANEETYISARAMAEYLRDNFNPNLKVKIELNENMGYAPDTKIRLSSAKLSKLGWEPRYGLKEIFRNLINVIKNVQSETK